MSFKLEPSLTTDEQPHSGAVPAIRIKQKPEISWPGLAEFVGSAMPLHRKPEKKKIAASITRLLQAATDRHGNSSLLFHDAKIIGEYGSHKLSWQINWRRRPVP